MCEQDEDDIGAVDDLTLICFTMRRHRLLCSLVVSPYRSL